MEDVKTGASQFVPSHASKPYRVQIQCQLALYGNDAFVLKRIHGVTRKELVLSVKRKILPRQ